MSTVTYTSMDGTQPNKIDTLPNCWGPSQDRFWILSNPAILSPSCLIFISTLSQQLTLWGAFSGLPSFLPALIHPFHQPSDRSDLQRQLSNENSHHTWKIPLQTEVRCSCSRISLCFCMSSPSLETELCPTVSLPVSPSSWSPSLCPTNHPPPSFLPSPLSVAAPRPRHLSFKRFSLFSRLPGKLRHVWVL